MGCLAPTAAASRRDRPWPSASARLADREPSPVRASAPTLGSVKSQGCHPQLVCRVITFIPLALETNRSRMPDATRHSSHREGRLGPRPLPTTTGRGSFETRGSDLTRPGVCVCVCDGLNPPCVCICVCDGPTDPGLMRVCGGAGFSLSGGRSEEHTSELQSR